MQLPLNLELRTPDPAPAIPNQQPRTGDPESRTLNPEPGALNPVLLFARHPRARRYLIRVTEDGSVRVTVPRWGSKREAAAFAARERAWIEKQLRRADAERDRRQCGITSGDGGERQPGVDERRALIDRAKKELPPRLMELAALHSLAVARISIRDQRWRWGSCSSKGHICLNWRLVTMPAEVRDYVLIHELLHLKRMDHSPKFWKLVAEACPSYKEARTWLRHAPRL